MRRALLERHWVPLRVQLRWQEPWRWQLRLRSGGGMTAAAFRAHLEALCWTQRGLAALLGVSPTIVNRWAIDHTDVPEPVAVWLEGLAAYLAEHPAPRHR